jgi:putative membrane-bound dehydrogenase-like protein
MQSKWIGRALAVCAALFMSGGACLPAAASQPADAISRGWHAAANDAVGVARIDITPDYPVRLSGFGFRRAESEGVTNRIWAKALAIGREQPVLILTVDNCGVPASLVNEVARRLERHHGIPRQRVAITCTHTHTAPMLTGVLPNLFGEPIPPEHQQRIDRYTRQLTDNLEKVADQALADRQPAKLSWGIGTVKFAVNRRAKDGPVDHDLPLLAVRGNDGALRAIYTSYATHCVTLSNNKISGDWAGFAAEQIERQHPGCVAMISIGCGAESNPSSGVAGDRVEVAVEQGGQIAAEVKRLLAGYLAPLDGPITATFDLVGLPLAELPTKAQWEELAKDPKPPGYNARVQLARLERGEPLRTKIDLPVQTFQFGDRLAMVFLGGEVVGDYSLRLKRELDGLRLWVHGYSNDVPCYIPSERVLKLGAYEGRGAMVYYDVPGPFAPGLEQKIIDEVHRQLAEPFKAPFDTNKVEPLPPSPQQAVATLTTLDDLAVELAVAEPLVIDPVAIDFGPDGRLWVAEMHDYPSGQRGDYQPGGRVRVVDDSDGDGRFDRSQVFLENIPFPTGVTVWQKGVLVCAAPDILYAEDGDGDGRADVVRKLYSGFGTENYQARVNSLEYGLDGWVYGSCGLFGGQIKSFAAEKPIALGDRDFRIHPDSGEIEPATGRTQQGRVRDDWGNWFGCSNSNFARHYVLADQYLRRNPHLAVSETTVNLPADAEASRVYPVSQHLQLFKLSGKDNRATAACGLGVYRDTLLGSEYHGDLFTCEPVSLVVHRLDLSPRGSTFAGHRGMSEAGREFLASTNNWFRPVQARTGPDGALWIVDMCRYVIEHPRWIPGEQLAEVDLRAGDRLGRIYRVVPKNGQPRKWPRLDQLDTAALVMALETPNGWQRDMATQMLLWQRDPTAVEPLRSLAYDSQHAEARLHAFCLLDQFGQLQGGDLNEALADSHPGVRRHAVRLAESRLAEDAALGLRLAGMTGDPDAQVRLQLACSLGAWSDQRAGSALSRLLREHGDDPYLTAAALSSLGSENIPSVLDAVFAPNSNPPPTLARQLLSTAVALGNSDRLLAALVRTVTPKRDGQSAEWQTSGLLGVLETLARHGKTVESLGDAAVEKKVSAMLASARRTAADSQAGDSERAAAIALLGRQESSRQNEIGLLGELLSPQVSSPVQNAAMAALARTGDDQVAAVLIAHWSGYTPALRTQAVDLLMSRPNWQHALLTAIESKTLPGSELDASRRRRLVEHRNETIRTLAIRVLGDDVSPNRRQVLADHKEVATMSGDRNHGGEVFTKRCAACHRLGNAGHAVGPDLTTVQQKTPQFLLTEILDPNRNVDSRYVQYTAITTAGRAVTGILASETATSITLKGQENKQEVLLRSELEELASTGKSIMPEGFEKDLSKQDLADLIAFLLSAATAP